jgi:hypothetical protein
MLLGRLAPVARRALSSPSGAWGGGGVRRASRNSVVVNLSLISGAAVWCSRSFVAAPSALSSSRLVRS